LLQISLALFDSLLVFFLSRFLSCEVDFRQVTGH